MDYFSDSVILFFYASRKKTLAKKLNTVLHCKDCKFETNSQHRNCPPQSQFPHSYDLYIPTIGLLSAAGKYVDRSWEYINRLQIQYINVEIGTEAAHSFSGNTYMGFRCSVPNMKFKKIKKEVFYIIGHIIGHTDALLFSCKTNHFFQIEC